MESIDAKLVPQDTLSFLWQLPVHKTLYAQISTLLSKNAYELHYITMSKKVKPFQLLNYAFL